MHNFFGQNCLSQGILGRSASLFLAATLVILAGCGGSGSASSPTSGTGDGSSEGTQVITGTAATGAPLAGASVTVQDGVGKTANGTTAADGTFAIAVTGMTPPFMLVAIPATGTNLYSILPAMDMASTNSQNVNITPITTLIMYELNGGADPATMYTGLTFASLTASAVTAKETIVRGKLPANTVNPIFSMMYGKFTAQVGGNDPYDAALDALGKITSISLTGVTLTTAAGTSTTYTHTASAENADTGSATTGPTLSLKLTDPTTGAAVTSISSTNPATLTATVTNSSGTGVANAIVSFTTDATLTAITPSATAPTNASGVATVTLSPATDSAAGAATITASTQVAGVAVSNSMGFTVGTAAVTVTAPVVGVTPLSAFGTTSLDVTVSVGGVPVTTPQNVTFSSICAKLGKAELSTGTVTAAGGVATASYRDNGCAGTDTITASAAGVTSDPTSLVVLPPTTGSIQFVSASPSNISLKGIGGVEASLVSFKVLDGSGKPLSGQKVTFGLSTTAGGIRLTPSDPIAGSSATSDTNGQVLITVNSGTVSTPVRVTASTIDTSTVPATILTTQSSGLTISTGIPDQDSFSLSAAVMNPEFWEIDGNTTTLTARLADHFNNPVPEGTVINFTTEGGSIVASCSTVIDSNGNSNCSSTLTSQAPRPADGRVTVLAYAVGEESFIDLNGNGVADLVPNEITDLPEAFRDDNENGVLDANETFIDFNQSDAYDGPDGQYSGVLCDSAKSSSGTCSTNKTIHVRKSVVIVFSGSTAVISKIAPAGTIDLVGSCSGTSQQVDLRIVDVNGNPMPAGTTIVVTTSDGTIQGTGSFVQGNTNVTPTAGVANYSVSVRDDSGFELNIVSGVRSTTCTDTNPRGVLTVTVTTPGGAVTTAQYNVIN